MYTPETSKHFIKSVDPATGIISYVLKTRVAAQQQSFYFVNPAMDDAGRYLWFMCTFPPSMYITLGVVDFERDMVSQFPETERRSGPLVDLQTGECIFAGPNGFYRRSPDPDEPLRLIADVPDELRKYGEPKSLGTHLTYSPDKSEIFVDARSGDMFIAGTLNLASGKFNVWREWDYCRNHGQFNPVDKDMALMAEDHWVDNRENKTRPMRYNDRGEYMRLWTVRRDGSEKMYPPLNLERATHEWWSRDGKKIYYCKYTLEGGNNGVTRINMDTGEHKVVALVRAWHAFTSRDESFLTFDENDVFYRGTPSRVGFYNVTTGKSVYIVSQNPPLASRDKPSKYHLDPHPQFVGNEKYVSYTTAVFSRPDVALSPVDALMNATK